MKSCALFILMVLSVYTYGQFTLKGVVKDDERNETLTGAGIRLDKDGNSYSSDRNGEFRIPGLKAGTYILQVQYLGYEKYSKEISISQDVFLEIRLKPTSMMTEGIQIRASRLPDKAAGSVQTITSREIKQVNTGQDLPFILQTTPSAVSTSDAGTGIGYTGLRIRGADMTRINVTVNGIPFNDPESQEVYWVDIPDIASSIDNVQIQRGVGTSVNGAASFGASINIQTTLSSPTPYAEIENSFGSFNSIHNSIRVGSGLINKHWSVDGRFSNITSDGYIDRATAKLRSWFLTGAWHGKNSLLKFNAFSGYERTYQAWDGISSDLLKTNRTFNPNGMYTDPDGHIHYYENEVDDYKQDHYHLLYTLKLADQSWANIALHYTRGKGYYEQYEEDEDPGFYNIPIAFGSPQKSDLITRKWLSNDFFGGTWSVNKQTKKYEAILGGAVNQYTGQHYGRVIWVRESFVAFTKETEWYQNTGVKKDANVFAKFRYTLLPKLNAYADLQYRLISYEIDGSDDDYRDLTQKHNFGFLNPKAGLSFDINKHQNIQLTGAIANREPTRSNFKDADPGREPKPERLYNSELSWNHASPNQQAGLCFYYMGYKDQLVLTGEINSVGAPIMVNVDKSYRAGVEILYGLRLLRPLDWKGNLNFSTNKINNFTAYADDWDNGGQIREELGETDLSFSPSVTANSTFIWRIYKGLTADWTLKYVGKQFIDNTSNDERVLDPYLINNLRLSYTLKTAKGAEIQIKLSLNNMFNEEYESNAWVYRYYYQMNPMQMNGYFPQAGRHGMVGVVIGI